VYAIGYRRDRQEILFRTRKGRADNEAVVGARAPARFLGIRKQALEQGASNRQTGRHGSYPRAGIISAQNRVARTTAAPPIMIYALDRSKGPERGRDKVHVWPAMKNIHYALDVAGFMEIVSVEKKNCVSAAGIEPCVKRRKLSTITFGHNPDLGVVSKCRL
jgi:hypothetical protein